MPRHREVSAFSGFESLEQRLLLSQAGLSVPAGGGDASEPAVPGHIVVSLDQPAASDTTVNLTISGTAKGGKDYVAIPKTVRIPAGEDSVVVDITPIDNTKLDGRRTVTLALAKGTGYTIDPAQKAATINIFDNELPAVTVVANKPTAWEAGLKAGQFTVARTGPTTDPLPIAFDFSGTTAVAGERYQPINAITIPAGKKSVTVNVNLIQEEKGEGDQRVVLNIDATDAYNVSGPGVGIVTIIDNDVAPNWTSILGSVLGKTVFYSLTPLATAGSFYMDVAGDTAAPSISFRRFTGTSAGALDIGSMSLLSDAAGLSLTGFSQSPLNSADDPARLNSPLLIWPANMEVGRSYSSGPVDFSDTGGTLTGSISVKAGFSKVETVVIAGQKTQCARLDAVLTLAGPEGTSTQNLTFWLDAQNNVLAKVAIHNVTKNVAPAQTQTLDFQGISTSVSDNGDLRVYKDGDLTFGVRGGTFWDGLTARTYAGSTGNALADNATNFVYLTHDGKLTVNQTGFPSASLSPVKLAVITTIDGQYTVTDITDYRGTSQAAQPAQQVTFDIRSFGAAVNGVTDDTAAVNAAIAAAEKFGGTVYFPAGVTTCYGQISIPFTGGTGMYDPPSQGDIILKGEGNFASGRGGGHSIEPNSGSIFDLRYAGGAGKDQPKMLTRGFGKLEMTGLTITDKTTGYIGTSNPYFLTTNTTVNIHDCTFWGDGWTNVLKAGNKCDQDAIVLGGTDNVSNPDWGLLTTSPFQGYGSVIENNFFNRMRRVVTCRNYANGVVIDKNTVWASCGTNLDGGGAIDIDGGGNGAPGVFGLIVQDNLIEAGGYAYPILVDHCQASSFIGNNFYDPSWRTLSYIRFGSIKASLNLVLEGYGDTTGRPYISEETPGMNTVIATNYYHANNPNPSVFVNPVKITSTLDLTGATVIGFTPTVSQYVLEDQEQADINYGIPARGVDSVYADNAEGHTAWIWLPNASDVVAGKRIFIKRRGTGTVHIYAFGTNTIDGLDHLDLGSVSGVYLERDSAGSWTIISTTGTVT